LPAGWYTDHIAEYIRGIRDDICLPKPPDMEVVLTGGSSVVLPLREEAIRSVRTALKHRRGETFEGARLVNVTHPESLGRSYREVEVAQLAVSLGASDPRLSELKAYPEGLVESRLAMTV
jgi:hypothetical protein